MINMIGRIGGRRRNFEWRNYGRTGRGGFRAEASEFLEGEGRAESGSGGGEKLGVRLKHGHDPNASGKKAVSLHGFEGLGSLKSSSI